MLLTIRDKAQGWIAYVIVILISIPFALWGIGEYAGIGGEPVVATVNGQEITERDFENRYQQFRNELRQRLPQHPNGMRFNAYDAAGQLLEERAYYSVGGGFVVDEDSAAEDRIVADRTRIPYPFGDGGELLALCERHGLRIAEIALANERAWREAAEIRAGVLAIHRAMMDSMERGFRQQGTLPGGLGVVRRAPALLRRLGDEHRTVRGRDSDPRFPGGERAADGERYQPRTRVLAGADQPHDRPHALPARGPRLPLGATRFRS